MGVGGNSLYIPEPEVEDLELRFKKISGFRKLCNKMSKKQITENETTEMWREIHNRQQATKKLIRNDRVKSIYNHLIDWTENDIEIFKLTDYQYRFVKGNHRIDYYPTSGKYFDITLNKRGTIPAYKIITLF